MPYLVRALLFDLVIRRLWRGRFDPRSVGARRFGAFGRQGMTYAPRRRLRLGCLPLGCLGTLLLCVTLSLLLSALVGSLH